MENLDTKEDRISWGNEAELAVMAIFDEAGVDVTHLEPGVNQADAFENLKHGDILINKLNKYIDVKRGNFISLTSALGFMGDYFVFIASDLHPMSAWIVEASTVRAYIKKVEANGNLVKGKSGDLGHRFREPLRVAKPLQYFIRDEI